MCARIVQAASASKIADVFRAKPIGEAFQECFNIAPGQKVFALAGVPTKRVFQPWTWGFPWKGKTLVNLRVETWGDSAQRRLQRVLIPANGFYEWRKDADYPRPYCFRLKNKECFALAALGDGEKERLAVLTRPASGLVRNVHSRAPLAFSLEAAAAWLNEGRIVAALEYEKNTWEAYPVSLRVNKSGTQGEDCWRPLVERQENLFGFAEAPEERDG